MKYFLIAGEASGDLHAAALIRALHENDSDAQFRCFGGDEMQAAGATLLCHYRELAYMGFIPVLLHLRTILRGMRRCREAIAAWRPDVVILVDYPGFNLKIARYVHRTALCPCVYYISPKIWAWKEHRIHALRENVDLLLSILPFEPQYFLQHHNYGVTYVGNPTLDEVETFRAAHPALVTAPRERLIAILPGSRRQEITDNLALMLQAATPYAAQGYRVSIAAAPAMPDALYQKIIARSNCPTAQIDLTRGETYALLSRAEAALVTCGTATLETALFNTPQVVCYYTACARLVGLLRKAFLRVPFVSLVNLIAEREVVAELVAETLTPATLARELRAILPGGSRRERQLQGYAEVRARLGETGAPHHAAKRILDLLQNAQPANGINAD